MIRVENAPRFPSAGGKAELFHGRGTHQRRGKLPGRVGEELSPGVGLAAGQGRSPRVIQRWGGTGSRASGCRLRRGRSRAGWPEGQLVEVQRVLFVKELAAAVAATA